MWKRQVTGVHAPCPKDVRRDWAMLVHPFNPIPLGRQRQVDLYEFKASLVYRVSSRIARAVTQRNLVSKKKTTTNGKGKVQSKLSESVQISLFYSLILNAQKTSFRIVEHIRAPNLRMWA